AKGILCRDRRHEPPRRGGGNGRSKALVSLRARGDDRPASSFSSPVRHAEGRERKPDPPLDRIRGGPGTSGRPDATRGPAPGPDSSIGRPFGRTRREIGGFVPPADLPPE